VRRCERGGGWQIEQTCTLSEVCADAECKPIVCAPGSRSCEAGEVRACNADGTGTTTVKTCGPGRFCQEEAGDAQCSDFACKPGAALCFADTATLCKPDGSGPEPGGTDCSAQGQACSLGACASATCSPGQKLCKGGDVFLCVGSGVESLLFDDCASDEICDDALAACLPRICEPGRQGCDSTRVVACNALGTGWSVPLADCASSNQLCIAGSCKTQICAPGSTFCDGSIIEQCDAKGLTSSAYQSCQPSYYHCVNNYYAPNSASCVYNTCTPGVAACNNNVATTCNADGSGYSADGVDCGASGVCQNGACAPKVCEGYGYFCKDKDVAYCQGGLSYSLQQTCGPDAYCAASGSSFSCVPYLCSAGLRACLENRVGTCGADGTTLSSVKEDCALAGKVCTSNAACGDSATDSVGVAEELQSFSSGYFFGDVIDVKSSRQLTQLEANVVLAAPRDLRYLVYEAYLSGYVAAYDKVVTAQSGSGYASSGAISFTLKAGRRYLLGVAVTGGGFVPYYDAAPFQPDVSFGAVAGSVAASYDSNISSYYTSIDRAYSLRFSTSLP